VDHLRLDRRTILGGLLASGVATRFADAQAEVTRPIVSEIDCPLEMIRPVATDGYQGLAVLRKPPGNGPFPAVVCLHEGMTTEPLARLQAFARDAANPSRFLAAGYVIVVPTYRSRDVDPQSGVSLADSVATVEHTRRLPYVDPDSIVVFGCSGGGDLALEVAARTKICAVVPEEPAIMLMSGMFNAASPKRGERFVPADSFFLFDNPKQYYTPEFQKILRDKIARIDCPIFLVLGEWRFALAGRTVDPATLMTDILIPELRAAGKALTVATYPEQLHCFCLLSGLQPAGRLVPPMSWPQAALQAFRDIDQFCRRYLRTEPQTIGPAAVTHVEVRQ
jgi:dienelactone hydrolase